MPPPVFLTLVCLSCRWSSKPAMDAVESATRGFNHESWMQIKQVWTCIRDGTTGDRSSNFVGRECMLILSRDGTDNVTDGVRFRAARQPTWMHHSGWVGNPWCTCVVKSNRGEIQKSTWTQVNSITSSDEPFCHWETNPLNWWGGGNRGGSVMPAVKQERRSMNHVSLLRKCG